MPHAHESNGSQITPTGPLRPHQPDGQGLRRWNGAQTHEGQSVPAGQCVCQPEHAEAAFVRSGELPQVDDDRRTAGADRGVQQAAHPGFYRGADLLPDLDDKAPCVTADPDGLESLAGTDGSVRPQPRRPGAQATGQSARRRAENHSSVPRHGHP